MSAGFRTCSGPLGALGIGSGAETSVEISDGAYPRVRLAKDGLRVPHPQRPVAATFLYAKYTDGEVLREARSAARLLVLHPTYKVNPS